MGAGVMGAGMLLQAYGSIEEGEAAYAQSRKQAQILAIRANMAKSQGATEAARIEAEGRDVQGMAKAQLAASGVDPTVGSAAGAIATSGVNAAADAVRVKAMAAMEAWGFKQQRRDVLAAGRQARRRGYLGGIGLGLAGAGQAYYMSQQA